MTVAVEFTVRFDASLERGVVVALAGELDYTNAERLRQDVVEALPAGGCDLIMDLTGLTFCDSTGIRVFLALRSLLDERGGTVALTGLQPRLRRIFHTTGLVRFFTVLPTVADAVDLLRSR
ncbi:STAS domain-containing protein [Planomonospora venezuelensis]|uniref:Anti-sigma factor antagonist n=1 Tax=Planomonospora venezuelensis TaxID=1999 RepID=A0A841DEB7_PLAVE|nr:anti-anti-sigma factor [Planomonospora venezuelensis]GIN03016.1 anti-sigma factor antagonist [Planomonospora venezuelensis]